MASDVYYTMLFVGQGMGNLVTITDAGQTAVKYTALVDFGSAKSSGTRDTIDFLIEYIEANRKATPAKKPDIDLLVISHQDQDHWNLLPTLMTVLALRSGPLTVGTFAWGGDLKNYKSDAAATVAAIKAIATTTLKIPVTEQSAYAASSPIGALASYPATNPEIAFKPVMCNATASATVTLGTSSMDLNTVSMMVGVVDVAAAKCLFLLPGDATVKTVASLKANETRAAELKGTLVLSIPHHGSHKSIADNYDSPANQRTFSMAQWFAGFVAPQTIGASAGFFTPYKHPHLTVLKLFNTAFTTNMPAHHFVAYDAAAGRYQSNASAAGVFTNYVSVDGTGKDGTATRVVYKYSGGALTVAELTPNAAPNPGLAR